MIDPQTMQLKPGAKSKIDPQVVLRIIEELKGDWSYPQIAEIMSSLLNTKITANAISKKMRSSKVMPPKMSGRKRDAKKADVRSLPPEFNSDALIG